MLSIKQFIILVNLNILFWIIISTIQCSNQDQNSNNNSTSTNFTDSVPELLPLDDANLQTNTGLLKPVHVGPSKKDLREKSHLPCPFELDSERKFRLFEVNDKVKFYTDRNRFLLNISPGELNTPEEQLKAFKETVFLALYLNRTIVLPNFFKSDMDKALQENIHAKRIVDAQDIISINKLWKYFPVITMDELYEHCISFDIGYLFKNTAPLPLAEPILDEMDRIERFTGSKIMDPAMNRFRGSFVKPKKDMVTGDIPEIPFNSGRILNYFEDHDTSAKCALAINPKDDVNYLQNLQKWADMMGSESDFIERDTDLPLVASTVVKATGRSKWVKNVVDKFKVFAELDRGYMVLVYDEKHIDDLLSTLNKVADKYSFSVIYVIIDIIYDQIEVDSIMKELSSKTVLRLKQISDLKKFMTIKYKDCPHERLNDELDESLELIQQQIGAQASSVIGSLIEQSETKAWVENLRDERLANRDHEFDRYLEREL